MSRQGRAAPARKGSSGGPAAETAMNTEFDQGGSPITIGMLAIIGGMAGGTILATTMGTTAGAIGLILGALGGAVLGLV